MDITIFTQQKSPGFELLEKELLELEKMGASSLPSLNHFLEKHGLYITKQDKIALRSLLKNNKKWKIVKVTDYQVVRRGKKK